MRLVTYRVVCARDHAFDAATPPRGSYGEFVMYGEHSPAPALLSAVEDPVYREVSALLREIPEVRGKSDIERCRLLKAVFGVACDPAPDGSRFRIGLPPCPTCGTRSTKSSVPMTAYAGDVLHITHAAWSSATKAQKLVRLKSAVEAYLGVTLQATQ
ncbi:MAG: hypothetical protein ABW321_35240 [Polyangiales bacterium]